MSAKKSPAGPAGKKVHTETTAALLLFASPPDEVPAQAVARECAAGGLESIGIHGPFGDDNVIDFSAMDSQSRDDLADFLAICVDQKGFKIPALNGTFDHFHAQGVKMTFGNFVKALTHVMKPKK